MVQWLRLHTSTAGGAGSIPGWETKIPNAVQCGQKKKKNKRGEYGSIERSMENYYRATCRRHEGIKMKE